MPTRRQFADFAHGLVGRYVSRRNDVGGRWGIGVLAESLDHARDAVITYDLLSSSPSLIVHAETTWLQNRLREERIPAEWVGSCLLRIAVTRDVEPPIDDHTRAAWIAGTQIHKVTVAAAIADDCGRTRSASRTVWCWDASGHPPLSLTGRRPGYR